MEIFGTEWVCRQIDHAMSHENTKEAAPAPADGESSSLFRWGWSEVSETAVSCIEYVGRTALVVTGPYTGREYRFPEPGAKLTVDIRDRHGLLAIPMLRSALG